MRDDDTDGRLALIEHQVLTLFLDTRAVAVILRMPRAELDDVSERARAGDLELSDLGLDLGDIADVLATRRGGDPEIESLRVAFALLETRKEHVAETLRSPERSLRF